LRLWAPLGVRRPQPDRHYDPDDRQRRIGRRRGRRRRGFGRTKLGLNGGLVFGGSNSGKRERLGDRGRFGWEFVEHRFSTDERERLGVGFFQRLVGVVGIIRRVVGVVELEHGRNELGHLCLGWGEFVGRDEHFNGQECCAVSVDGEEFERGVTGGGCRARRRAGVAGE
jgi:hypothetical protein